MILVDGHVHFHPCYDPVVWLEAAHRNLSRAARKLRLENVAHRVLLVADGRGQDVLRSLRRGLGLAQSEWSLEDTAEEVAVRVHRDGRDPMLVVRGRQLVSRERLEVLDFGGGLGSTHGQPFLATVERAVEAGGITVVPWGFGKWWGARKELVEEAVADAGRGSLFVADSGTRPWWTPSPGLIARARKHGVFNLPGTDPLPLRREQTRAGLCGAVLEGSFDERCPMRGLIERARDLERQPPTFREGTSLTGFVVGQVTMQLRRLGPYDGRAPSGDKDGAA